MPDVLPFDPLTVLIVAAITAGVFLFLALLSRSSRDTVKGIFFLGIAVPVILATLYLLGSTISLNRRSLTGGPVHWHADLRIFHCGTELDIVDPEGLLNRVGTPLLHEHGDKRIHVEGRVMREEDATLPMFFKVIGGSLTKNSMAVPRADNGLLLAADGQTCPDGQPGRLQVFVHSVENGAVVQRKLVDPAAYRFAPHSDVPPGDCVIVEFGSDKERTDHLCRSYELSLERGKLRRE
jgi:hypothetical protein